MNSLQVCVSKKKNNQRIVPKVHCQQFKLRFCEVSEGRATRETRVTRARVVGGEPKDHYKIDVVYLQNVIEHRSW